MKQRHNRIYLASLVEEENENEQKKKENKQTNNLNIIRRGAFTISDLLEIVDRDCRRIIVPIRIIRVHKQ